VEEQCRLPAPTAGVNPPTERLRAQWIAPAEVVQDGNIREELGPYASKLHDMQFRGEKPKTDGNGVWKLYGI